MLVLFYYFFSFFFFIRKGSGTSSKLAVLVSYQFPGMVGEQYDEQQVCIRWSTSVKICIPDIKPEYRDMFNPTPEKNLAIWENFRIRESAYETDICDEATLASQKYQSVVLLDSDRPKPRSKPVFTSPQPSPIFITPKYELKKSHSTLNVKPADVSAGGIDWKCFSFTEGDVVEFRNPRIGAWHQGTVVRVLPSSEIYFETVEVRLFVLPKELFTLLYKHL